jgi:hypothetical protein
MQLGDPQLIGMQNGQYAVWSVDYRTREQSPCSGVSPATLTTLPFLLSSCQAAHTAACRFVGTQPGSPWSTSLYGSLSMAASSGPGERTHVPGMAHGGLASSLASNTKWKCRVPCSSMTKNGFVFVWCYSPGCPRTCYIAQAGFEFTIFLPQPLKGWHRCVPSYLAQPKNFKRPTGEYSTKFRLFYTQALYNHTGHVLM